MTRKQLEGLVTFMVLFNHEGYTADDLNEKFGVSITEFTSQEEAITAYLEAKEIKLEKEVEY